MESMKRFLLARELPAIFALCMVGAAFAFGNRQPAWGIWLLFAALWCFLFWLILLPTRAKRTARAKIEQREKRANQQQCHRKRGHAA